MAWHDLEVRQPKSGILDTNTVVVPASDFAEIDTGDDFRSQAQSWADIAAYLSRMPSNPAAESGDGSHLALGRGIFHEQCSSCHQADAGGDQDGLVPALKGQHYSYLVGQLHQLAADRRHNVDEELQRFLHTFDAQEIEGVPDYLSRQHTPGKSHQVMREDGTVVD